jgi:hypothetical protein
MKEEVLLCFSINAAQCEKVFPLMPYRLIGTLQSVSLRGVVF